MVGNGLIKHVAADGGVGVLFVKHGGHVVASGGQIILNVQSHRGKGHIAFIVGNLDAEGGRQIVTIKAVRMLEGRILGKGNFRRARGEIRGKHAD